MNVMNFGETPHIENVFVFVLNLNNWLDYNETVFADIL